MGTMLLALHTHTEFQVVTPRSLSAFKGSVLILPESRCLSAEENSALRTLMEGGTDLIITGQTGEYEVSGKKRDVNITKDLKSDIGTGSEGRVVFLDADPGVAYSAEIKKEFNQAAWQGDLKGESFQLSLKAFKNLIGTAADYKPKVRINASPFICAQTASVDNKTMIFLSNFKGIKGKERLKPYMEKNIMIDVTTSVEQNVYFLPYLGEIIKLDPTFNGRSLSVQIPRLGAGGIIWLDSN
jgi:hypothetical protein